MEQEEGGSCFDSTHTHARTPVTADGMSWKHNDGTDCDGSKSKSSSSSQHCGVKILLHLAANENLVRYVFIYCLSFNELSESVRVGGGKPHCRNAAEGGHART